MKGAIGNGRVEETVLSKPFSITYCHYGVLQQEFSPSQRSVLIKHKGEELRHCLHLIQHMLATISHLV